MRILLSTTMLKLLESLQWIICEHAAYNNNSVLVPLYETLGPNAATYIINHTEMETVIVDEEVKAESE